MALHKELYASYITVFFDNRVGTHATICLCCAETLSVDLQTGTPNLNFRVLPSGPLAKMDER